MDLATTSPEVWRPIPSVPGLLASSLGRLMVVPYVKEMPYGGHRVYGGEPTIGQWDGTRYLYILKGRTYKVHRLICEAFSGKAPNGSVCMHLDEDSANNTPSNLKWGTQKENLNAPGFIEYCKSRVGANSPVVKGRLQQRRSN